VTGGTLGAGEEREELTGTIWEKHLQIEMIEHKF
jgi:hypothetical protein